MATYTSPGVYVKHVPSGSAPIAGVGTSTAAFVGVVPDGIKTPDDKDIAGIGEVKLVTNFTEFKKVFGDFSMNAGQSMLAHAVYGFFLNGGTRCYVVRIAPDAKRPSMSTPILDFEQERVAFEDARQRFVTPQGLAEDEKPSWAAAQTGFDTALTAFYTANAGLRSSPDKDKLAAIKSAFTTAQSAFDTTVATPLPKASDEIVAVIKNAKVAFAGALQAISAAEAGASVTMSPFGLADALATLEAIDEIAIVAAPGLTDTTAHSALVAHCEKMETRVAVLDAPVDPGDDLNTALGPESKAVPLSSQAALYFPWIQVHDPVTNAAKFVPPSGHIAGIYARVDAQRGVHKAPANETIRGALEVKYQISRAQQDGLNPHGVNCIRWMNGSIKVWGARTAGGSKNTEFTYLNVRRLYNYLHASLDQGMQWAVFEPNNHDLWAKITRNITAFLTNVWASGALFGDKPEDAFYVKCDAETNPPSLRDLGQVVTEVGVAISRPAEFVIIKLGQKAAS